MKNAIYIAHIVCVVLLLLSGMPCHGQLRTDSVREIAASGVQPVLSQSGDFVLVRDAGEPGLARIDLQTGKQQQVVQDTNIDGDVVLSDGGSMVAYRTIRYEDHLRYATIKATNIRTGSTKELDVPSREKYAFRFAGGKMKIAKRNTIRTQRLLTDIRPVAHEYVLAAEEEDLVLYDGKIRKVLNPNGKNTYLWERLSPDEQHIVYVAINDACHTYVCDTDGSNVVDLGHYIGAPCWLGNDWIIGQQDEDDGHRMTSSRLVAIHPDGTGFQILPTPGLTMPINPSGSIDGKVAFENEGKIYVMEVR